MGMDANISKIIDDGILDDSFEPVMDDNRWFNEKIISYHRAVCILRPDVYEIDRFSLEELEKVIAFQEDNFSAGAIEITTPFIEHLELEFVSIIQSVLNGVPLPDDLACDLLSRNLLLLVRMKDALKNKQHIIYVWSW